MKKLILFTIVLLLIPTITWAGLADDLKVLFDSLFSWKQEIALLDQQLGAATVTYPQSGGTGTSTTPTDLKLLLGRGNGTYYLPKLTAGSNITIATSTTALTITGVSTADGSSNWNFSGVNAIKPTSTVGIIVSASSTFTGYITAGGGFTGNASTADALKANPSDCSANQFANTIAASGDLTCVAIADADVPDTITVSNYLLLTGGTLTGNLAGPDIALTYGLSSATATFTGYISAAGFTGKASTTAAFAANPTNCSSGNSPLGIDASGAVESCFDVWTEAENTSAAYWNALSDISLTEGYVIVGNNAGVAMATSTLFVNADNGNVGIGTTNPDTPAGGSAQGGAPSLHLSGNTPIIIFEDQNDNQDWSILAVEVFDIKDITDNAVRFRIDGSGNIGIGTTTSAAKLTLVETGSQNILNLWANATSVMSVDVSGNVALTGAMYQDIYGSDDGLVLYLPFSEGMTSSSANIAYDRSPYGNDGTATGMPMPTRNATSGESGWSTTTCKVGSCMSFDGTDDTVYKSAPSFINDTQGSVEFWFKLTATNADYVISSISVEGATGALRDEYLFLYYRGEVNKEIELMAMANGVTLWDAKTANNIVTDTNWHHWVVISDGTTVKAYLDGTARTLTNVVGTNTGRWMAAATDADVFTLGAIRRDVPVLDYTGQIDEVRVYNRALSADEIRAHYLRGTNTNGAVLADKFRIIGTDNNIDFIVNSGDVGIGTTTPAMSLDVAGMIRAYKTSTTTCDASIRGAIFYNQTDDIFWGCKISGWVRLDQ